MEVTPKGKVQNKSVKAKGKGKREMAKGQKGKEKPYPFEITEM